MESKKKKSKTLFYNQIPKTLNFYWNGAESAIQAVGSEWEDILQA